MQIKLLYVHNLIGCGEESRSIMYSEKAYQFNVKIQTAI